MATIKIGFWALRTEPLPDILLEFCNILEYVTIKTLLQRCKSLWAKSGLYGWHSRHYHPNSCNKVADVRQCEESAPGDFHLFGPLKKHLGGHICQTDVEVQEAVSKSFFSQNYVLQAGRHSPMTLSDTCVNHFRVTMNKTVPNKEIFTVYSYFPINPRIVQGGSNMTGTKCGLFTHKSVRVIFEPPCIMWAGIS